MFLLIEDDSQGLIKYLLPLFWRDYWQSVPLISDKFKFAILKYFSDLQINLINLWNCSFKKKKVFERISCLAILLMLRTDLQLMLCEKMNNKHYMNSCRNGYSEYRPLVNNKTNGDHSITTAVNYIC